MTQPAANPIRRPISLCAILSVLCLLTAAAVRLAGMNCQLWLDEIWSIRLAQTAGSPLGILLLHHDNNHWLNTFADYLLGPGRPWWAYHVLPEVTGIGAVLLGWLIARRRGEWQGFAALVLLGGSEFLIEYSSDARGYAPLGFFALLCVWLLDQHLARPRRWTVALMSASAALAILSHLTSIAILAGLIAASALSLFRRRRSWPAAISHTALWWAVPVATLTILYVIDIRFMIRGGGPPTPADLPGQTAAMLLGFPLDSRAAPIFGIAAFLLCAIQIGRLYCAADPEWPVFLSAALFVPVVLFCLPRTIYLHPRYIYVAAPFILILCGMELGRWLASGGWRAGLSSVVLLAFVGVNAGPISTFLFLGRGDYVGAVNFILDQTVTQDVVVGADRHPTSTLMVLEYYTQYHVHTPHRIETFNNLVGGDQWPQWLVTEENVGQALQSSTGAVFVRRATFPDGAVTSGIPWIIYEAESGAARARPENLRALAR